jgi:LAO/AO transport system kinase
MAQRQLRNALHLYPLPESGWSPEVLTYSGYYNLGITEVWDMIHRYIDFVKQNGFFDLRRREQAKYWMFESINEQLRNGFYRDPEIAKLLLQLEDEVLHSRKSSFVAAREAIGRYYRNGK